MNDRFQIEDGRFAEMLWEGSGLRELVMRGLDEGDEGEAGRTTKDIWGGEPLGLNPNIRIYRYTSGQFFARHCMFSFFSPR